MVAHKEEGYGDEIRIDPARIYQFGMDFALGMNKGEIWDAINEVHRNKMLKPILGAPEAFSELTKNGWRLFVVTSRPPHFHLNTIENLKMYFPDFSGDIVYAQHGFQNKYIVCDFLRADYIIDDSLKILNDFTCWGYSREKGISTFTMNPNNSTKILILKQPWNEQGQNILNLYTLCKDWNEIVEIINGTT